MANTGNLKPFTGADDPRRQNGRKKGSKNVSTLVRELLESEISSTSPFFGNFCELGKTQSPAIYAKALVIAMLEKALQGDVRCANWIMEQYDKSPDPEGFFSRPVLNFTVVSDRKGLDDEN